MVPSLTMQRSVCMAINLQWWFLGFAELSDMALTGPFPLSAQKQPASSDMVKAKGKQYTLQLYGIPLLLLAHGQHTGYQFSDYQYIALLVHVFTWEDMLVVLMPITGTSLHVLYSVM